MNNGLDVALQQLQSSNIEVREQALDTIGSINPKNALDIILPFLYNPDAEIRGTAAFNLGEIHNDEAVSHLINLIHQEKNDQVRSYALQALGEYHSDAILKLLVAHVQQGQYTRRYTSIVAEQLGNYDNERAIDALVALFESDDVYLFISAADALLKLNRPRLHDVWLKLLRYAYHPYLCNVALTALASLEDKDVFDILTSLLSSTQSEDRGSAAYMLGQLDDQRAIPLLLHHAKDDPDEGVRDMALLGLAEYDHPEIYSFLISVVKQQKALSATTKETIAQQLGSYVTDQSIDMLKQLLNDQNQTVRATVADSLYQLNRPDLEDIWQQLQHDDQSYIRRVAMNGLKDLECIDKAIV